MMSSLAVGQCFNLFFVILIIFQQQTNTNDRRFDRALSVPAQQVESVTTLPNNQQKVLIDSTQKTADLSLLINETLKINNKSASVAIGDGVPNSGAGEKVNFRDDWTFDRVEYDLMEFLQELNARYNNANKSLGQHVDAAVGKQIEQRKAEELEQPPSTNGPETSRLKNLSLSTSHPMASKENQEATLNNTNIQPTQLPAATSSSQSPQEVPSGRVNQEIVTKASVEAVKEELDEIFANKSEACSSSKQPLITEATSKIFTNISSQLDKTQNSSATSPASVQVQSASELPISLASGDHDISESTWQYGIFDRFTRPKASSTTAPRSSSSDSILVSGSNNVDSKAFNSDECGLRTYIQDPGYYPTAVGGSGDLMDEMTKELSQRRQRPSLGSALFAASHKKYHQPATGENQSPSSGAYEASSDELDHDQPVDSPPFDRYGEPATLGAGIVKPGQIETSSPYSDMDTDVHTLTATGVGSNKDYPNSAPASPSVDSSEFNLSLRRQWLQQQLGSTLQMLGFTNTTASEHLANRTQSKFNLRENMMKMSAVTASQKFGKSLLGSDKNLAGNQVEQAAQSATSVPQATTGELSEQELKARQDELKLEARVIGGNDARLGDSPWSASLQALVSRPGTGGVEYRHYCGGTIISEHYILTAAHCLDFMVGRESRLFVVIGDLNWRMSTSSMHGRRFGIEKLIIHGGYKSTAFGHDVGLIKTKESMRPLKANGRYIINSVCLPEKNVEHSGEAELVGWGLFSNRNEMADSLQIADVPILPRPLCVDLYRRRTGLIQWLIGIELITEKQVCAGTFGRGICQGDSGSALVFNEKVQVGPDGRATNRLRSNLARDQQQRATIIGTVAFGGIRRCSYQSLPGVYMQTSKYLDWILPRIQ